MVPFRESIEDFPATSYLRVDSSSMFDHNSNLNYFQEFTLTDDCVLQEHHEDPRLVHMTLLGENSEFNLKIEYGMVMKLIVETSFESNHKISSFYPRQQKDFYLD